jgi:hypothetical protein
MVRSQSFLSDSNPRGPTAWQVAKIKDCMAGHAAAVAARQSSPSLLNNKKPLVISIGHVQTAVLRSCKRNI